MTLGKTPLWSTERSFNFKHLKSYRVSFAVLRGSLRLYTPLRPIHPTDEHAYVHRDSHKHKQHNPLHFSLTVCVRRGEDREGEERRGEECGACRFFIVLARGWMTELEAPHSLQHNDLHNYSTHALIHLWEGDVLAQNHLKYEKIQDFP